MGNSVNYNKIIKNIFNEPLYREQPIKMISIVFENDAPIALRTFTDNHGYEYRIDNSFKIFQI